MRMRPSSVVPSSEASRSLAAIPSYVPKSRARVRPSPAPCLFLFFFPSFFIWLRRERPGTEGVRRGRVAQMPQRACCNEGRLGQTESAAWIIRSRTAPLLHSIFLEMQAKASAKYHDPHVYQKSGVVSCTLHRPAAYSIMPMHLFQERFPSQVR